MPRIPIRQPATWVSATLLVLSAMMFALFLEVRELRRATEALHSLSRDRSPIMSKIESKWISGGIEKKIVTTRDATIETVDQWLQRHKDEVDAAKVIWPPDQ